MRGNFISRFFLFLLAYVPIYLILALKSFHLEFVLDKKGGINTLYHIVKNNQVSTFLALISLLLVLYFLLLQRKSLVSQGNPKFQIKNIQSQNKEYITYLGTYILPFIALETKSILDIAAYIVLFVTMGLIYIRTNLIFTNPMLLFFGYDLIEITDTNNNKNVCISKYKFREGDKPIGIKLGENTYILSKWRKEN